MKVNVFTDNKNLQKLVLEENAGNKDFPLEVFPINQIKKVLNTTIEPTLSYFDITGLQDNINRYINFLAKHSQCFFGIIESRGSATDLSAFLFAGMVDFIKGASNYHELTEKRFKKVLNYLQNFRADFLLSADKSDREKEMEALHNTYITCKNDWEDIQPENEYTFSIVFIELDGKEKMEKSYNKKNLESAVTTFKRYIEKDLNYFKGKLWHWSGFTGVYIFPFNGKDVPAILWAVRLNLFKCIYDIEDSPFPNFITFKTCLDLGNILYTEKNRGNIISNSINYIFHLGKKHTKPGEYYLTERVRPFIPAPLKQLFIAQGTFEKSAVYRMKKPHLDIN